MAWDVLSEAAKMAWDVLSGVTKTTWDVLCGDVLSYILDDHSQEMRCFQNKSINLFLLQR